jgi:hypothetical protein
MNWFKLNLILIANFICLIELQAQLPEEYAIKDYVQIETQTIGTQYFHQYRFKDHNNRLQNWAWTIPISQNDFKTETFGLDLKYISGNQVEIEAANRNFFKLRDNKVSIDYSATVDFFKELALPLYQKFKQQSDLEKLTYREQIEFLLRFLQDYPYGIVPTNFGGKFVNGLMPISEIFKTGWSDCDSKSLLMAAILSYHPYFHDRLAMILVPGHALLGIEMLPRPYEKYATHRGRKYVYAEPVGVVRTPLGQTNSPYSNSIRVIPIDVRFEPSKKAVFGLSKKDCPPGAWLIKYELESAMNYFCTVKQGTDIINHGPAVIVHPDGRVETKTFEMGQEI